MNEQALYQKTISKTLRGPYLFQGEEELTKQEAVERIQGLLDSSFLDMNLHKLKNPSARDLMNSADQLPFFDFAHLVIVSEWSDSELYEGLMKEDKTSPGTIDRFFSLSDAIILFIRRGDGRESLFSKLFSSRDRLVSFSSLTPDRAAKFCMREAALSSVNLSDSSARVLIDMVGTDAYRLRNELSKAIGYVGPGGTISSDILETVVTPSTEYNAFKMLDALISGNRKAALQMLTTVIKSGKESPMGIAGFLEGRLRLMLIAREMLDQKQPQKSIVAAIGGNPYAAEAAIKNARKYDAETLKKAVASFAEVNAFVKSGDSDEKNALYRAVFQSFR